MPDTILTLEGYRNGYAAVASLIEAPAGVLRPLVEYAAETADIALAADDHAADYGDTRVMLEYALGYAEGLRDIVRGRYRVRAAG